MKYWLISFAFMITIVQALILEDLAKNNKLQDIFNHKKVGFYVGSFDPLHKGHQEAAYLAIKHGLCDYVLIYPAWGGDSYKNRVDIKYRLDMIFSIFEKDPHVIVTRLPPAKLQDLLTLPDNTRLVNDKPTVKPAFKGIEFIGIIGSDVALEIIDNPEALAPFMQGLRIPEKYKEHTIGGIISLPVKRFIVTRRMEDDLSSLNGKVGDRPIIAILQDNETQGHSSTAAKKALQEDRPIDTMIDERIRKIIKENSLYQAQ